MKRLNDTQSGQSIIEVVIASSFFLIAAIGALSVTFQYFDAIQRSRDISESAIVLQESVEAVRSISYDNFASLADGTYGLELSGSEWTLGSTPDLVDNTYTRTVTVNSMQRDENCLPVTTGGDDDPDTKQLNIQLDWTTDNNSFQQSVTTYATNWSAPTATCGAADPFCTNSETFGFYNSFNPGTSGNYPTYGSSSDSVTLTSGDPESEGYITITETFAGITEPVDSATISMEFEDLDLQGDNFRFGSRRVTLTETFELLDENEDLITTLDDNDPYDDDFEWEFDLPTDIFDGDTLTLKFRFAAHVELTSGSSITISNSEEAINNIQICGNNG